MVESFVNTSKRDYVIRMDLSDARTVLAPLPAAFERFNEVHPHSSLRMKSPRDFRRQRVSSHAALNLMRIPALLSSWSDTLIRRSGVHDHKNLKSPWALAA